MRIVTPTEVARQAGNKYLGVLVAAKYARHLNELPKERIADREEKLTTMALGSLVSADLTFKLLRRRRSEA
jgi:DNA-directed RNA polymerase subunit K/omega